MKRPVLALLASAALASCITPYHPPGPATGVSLDTPASGQRSNRQTRYLEESQSTQVPPADPNATAQTQAPTNTPPPPSDTPAPADPNTPSSTTPAPSTPAGTSGTATTPPAPTTPAAPAELPFGKPVPGKKGYVYSPYDSQAGFVDVRDIAPGTKVKCPYTGKVFRVP